MPHVVIIASGEPYQAAAAWAAATYAQFRVPEEIISVLVPKGEALTDLLRSHARRFGFVITPFPLKLVSKEKFTSQLKCQGMRFAVSHVRKGEVILFVDADTCCLRPIIIPPKIRKAVLAGKIAMVEDVNDYHFLDPTVPWFLGPHERAPYVNSGVIAASKTSLPLFQKFHELSQQPRFLEGPFNDQKVINYALGKYFKDRLVLLDEAYNRIVPDDGPGVTTFILHQAGGAGYLGEMTERKNAHAEKCAAQLRESGM